MNKEDEAYVHEAFLADWMPENNASSRFPTRLPSQKDSPGCTDIQAPIGLKSAADLR